MFTSRAHNQKVELFSLDYIATEMEGGQIEDICGLCNQPISDEFHLERFKNLCPEECVYHTTCLVQKLEDMTDVVKDAELRLDCGCGSIVPVGKVYGRHAYLMRDVAERIATETNDRAGSSANRDIIRGMEKRIKILNEMLTKLILKNLH